MVNENKETIKNILIAFSMLVGMVAVYVFESIINKPKEWVVIDINNLIDIVDVGVDLVIYGVSIVTAHPLTIVVFVGFMVWFMGKLK